VPLSAFEKAMIAEADFFGRHAAAYPAGGRIAG
jgi:hypothetical protein